MNFRKTRRVRQLTVAILLALAIRTVATSSALAHPLGNFTINHYSRLELSNTEVRLRYVLDMAEIPTFQERQIIDQNGDGNISDEERVRYLASRVGELRHNLKLQVDDRPIDLLLVPNSAELEFPPGQGGLPTMRLSAWLTAPFSLQPGQTFTANYRDENYPERIGWREIVVRPGDSITLLKSNVPSQETSAELRQYPQDLLTQPLAEREADFTFTLWNSSTQLTSPKPVSTGAFGALDRTRDAFAELITTKELSLPIILISLVAAMFLGGLHAFSPGHGKTIVGAYLVGARGTPKHALVLGLVVTATHTAGVYALGLVTLFASQYIVPEALYPWLGVTSGVLVALIGLQLFLSRFASMRAGSSSHVHPHAHPHPHSHGDGARHDHSQEEEDELGHVRSHIPDILSGAPLKWRNLVSLGISGGLLPCPSALVVLLSAIALGRVAFGLILIVAFSIGLASVLTLTGVALLYAGRMVGRALHDGRMTGRVFRALPVASALVVAVLGVGIAAEAFLQTGLVK
jgi:nickel/cobalt exporter